MITAATEANSVDERWLSLRRVQHWMMNARKLCRCALRSNLLLLSDRTRERGREHIQGTESNGRVFLGSPITNWVPPDRVEYDDWLTMVAAIHQCSVKIIIDDFYPTHPQTLPDWETNKPARPALNPLHRPKNLRIRNQGTWLCSM